MKTGFIALILVLVLGAAALGLALSSSGLGLGELDTAVLSARGGEVLAAAEGCLEDALERLRLNPSYSGSNLTLGEASCIITITGSTTKTIEVQATLGEVGKRLRATATPGANNSLTLNSWEELAN